MKSTQEIRKEIKKYTAISVDGSQIYPDRHQGTGCFLINIGSVTLSYAIQSKPVVFNSRPYVFLGYEYDELEKISADIVNVIRQEFELKAAAERDYSVLKKLGPTAVFFDGPLMFWFLENKEPGVRNMFLARYVDSLWQLFEKKVLCAGYISMPRSRDLVTILRVALQFITSEVATTYTDSAIERQLFAAVAAASQEYKEKITKRLSDVAICRWFLQPFERTILFKNNAPMCVSYPQQIQPYFFYLHVGSEIVRIEIPAWIAHQDTLVDTICQIAIDQAIKGRGYPVVLAEAHEQAVVKAPDREFFYHALTKLGIVYKKRFALSQKSIKKRSIGI